MNSLRYLRYAELAELAMSWISCIVRIIFVFAFETRRQAVCVSVAGESVWQAVCVSVRCDALLADTARTHAGVV